MTAHSEPEAGPSGARWDASDSVDGLAADLTAVEDAQRGDRGAFARLYRSYGPMVHGIVLARVPRGDAADLVQDVFVTALRKLGSLDKPAAFGSWLAAIARNRAIDFQRSRRESIELPDELGSADPKFAEARAVLDAIRTLPEAYGETMVMRLIEGMTGPEIALRTGMTPGSVRVNLHRGMQKLRAILAGEEAGR